MYGHESGPTRVYKYGAKQPERHLGEVTAALRRAREYRNALVRTELRRRELADEIVHEAHPHLTELRERAKELDAAIEKARNRIRAANQRRRQKRVADETRERVRGLKAERARCWEEYGTAKKAAYRSEEAADALAELDGRARERAKRLRAMSGLYWGTYLAVEQGLSGIRSGAPPKPVGRGWAGKLAVQVQGGASWGDLMAGEVRDAQVERVEIEPSDYPRCGCGGTQHPQCEGEGKRLVPQDGGRRSERPWYRLHLRIGGTARDRSDWVYAPVRFALHRQIPDDALVKWIYLVPQKVGGDVRWSVQFVLAREAGWDRGDTHTAEGAAGVDLRWRMRDDGSILVAHVEGTDGRTDELVIPAERLDRWRKVDDLTSIRDRRFNLAREVLARWLDVHAEHCPDWLRDEASHLRQWRSPGRLLDLSGRWNDARFAGDSEPYGALAEWATKERHLRQWQEHQRRGEIRWRLDHYRRFAARLRWTYETVGVEDANWKDLLSRPKAEDDDDVLDRRWHGRIASPGLLRDCVRQSLGDAAVVEVETAGTTRTCSTCGSDAARDWDGATEDVYRCEAGHRMEQWVNAGRNLCAAASSGGVVEE